MTKCAFLRAVFVCVVAVNSPAIAQDTEKDCDNQHCSCSTDISPAGIMIAHTHNKGEWMLSYRPMFMQMDGVSGSGIPFNEQGLLRDYAATPESMRMNMHMLMVMGGLSDKLTVMAMFHYQSANMVMRMQMGKSQHRHSMSSNGVGDTKLYAIYKLWQHHTMSLISGLGLSIPTGAINNKGETSAMMYPGLRLPYSMQNGSGTLDLLPSITFLHQTGNYAFSAQLNGVVRGNKNVIGYRYGNAIECNAWLGKSFFETFSATIRLNALFAASMQGADKQVLPDLEPAASNANYGGSVLTAFLGSSFIPASGWFNRHRFGIEFGLPIAERYKGIQMHTSWLLNCNWSYSF